MTASPFDIRGMIEGFYGVYYTHPERLGLLRFLGAHGYNLYIYGPKNDRQHRARWRETYSPGVMRQFEESAQVAREAGVRFCYSLSPGVEISYASQEDFEAVISKYAAFYEIGVRSFSLLLDDIVPGFRHEADAARYGNYAEAHADMCNRVHGWLQERDPACSLSMCPTDYHGMSPFSTYLHGLGRELHPDIDIFYTGPQVCSRVVPTKEAEAFAEAVRRPPVIWDNYPVNDLAMERELHLGPVRGREPSLAGVVKGLVVNTMIQAEASKISLATFADYFSDPQAYQPDQAWKEALVEVAGDHSAQALRVFAENSLKSCLGAPESEALAYMTKEALTALRLGESVMESPAVHALQGYLTELDEACYHLKFHMENLALRNDLLPWLELAENWLWAARYALEALSAKERGAPYERPLELMKECAGKAHAHHKRIGADILLPLAELALEQTEQAVAS